MNSKREYVDVLDLVILFSGPARPRLKFLTERSRDEDLKSLVGIRDSFFFIGLEHSRATGTLGNAPPALYHFGPRHHEICKKESNLSLHLGFLGRVGGWTTYADAIKSCPTRARSRGKLYCITYEY